MLIYKCSKDFATYQKYIENWGRKISENPEELIPELFTFFFPDDREHGDHDARLMLMTGRGRSPKLALHFPREPDNPKVQVTGDVVIEGRGSNMTWHFKIYSQHYSFAGVLQEAHKQWKSLKPEYYRKLKAGIRQ